MRLATRPAVHSWLGQPCLWAPWSKTRPSLRRWYSESRGVGPVWGLGSRPAGVRARRRQRWTEVSWTPKMRATVEGDSPWLTRSTARRRRRSSSAAVPMGLVIPYYTDVQTPRQALLTLASVEREERERVACRAQMTVVSPLVS